MCENMARGRFHRADGTTIQAIENAVDIIETLEELDGATPTELARTVDMPRSTVHVYLRTLSQYGYVVERSGIYRTGLRFLTHGGIARANVEIYRAATAEVERLAVETGELSDLGVEQNGMRVLLYKAETEHAVYDNVVTGEFTHMHWTALGKALLAWTPEETVSEIVDSNGLPRATETTITDPNELLEELDRTVERGYAIGDEERRRGITSIGVPILDDATQTAVAALSVAGPRSRILNDNIDAIVEELEHSANVVELRYNHY